MWVCGLDPHSSHEIFFLWKNLRACIQVLHVITLNSSPKARNYAPLFNIKPYPHRQGVMPRRLFTTALLTRNYAHRSQLPHWQGIMPPLFDNYTTGKELCRADCSQLHYWQGITPTVHNCPTGKELCRSCLITTPQARSYAAQIVCSCSTTQNMN